MNKPVGNRSWEGYQVSGNVFAGFAHLYYPSFPEFIERFLRKI
jgi:cobyrinic acid a,c-diamide synthase